jgi:hypothetical protein
MYGENLLGLFEVVYHLSEYAFAIVLEWREKPVATGKTCHQTELFKLATI